MVTASHNPECDNGIKIVDADGGMMAQSWESYAEELVNARSSGDILLALERIAASHSIDRSSKCVVVVGRDTRPHSEELVKCIIQGAEAYGATVHDMGLVTTPQLHFIVQKANEQATSFPILTLDRQAAIANYHSTLGKGYLSLIESAVLSGQPVTPVSIVVDGSCGIGAISMADFLEHFQKVKPEALHIDIRNAAFSGPVNEGCGAEYVQKGQMPPRGVSADTDSGKTLCSFDGDADRIVFHSYLADTKQWILLDGDKIAALFSLFISQELVASGLHNDFSLGVVQTAYANGASTIFLRNNNIAVTMAKTGVKFLHHKAHEFDIGIYFEANGHGTVLFSNAFVKRLQSWESSHSQKASRTPEEERQELAMRRLIVRIHDKYFNIISCKHSEIVHFALILFCINKMFFNPIQFTNSLFSCCIL
jgi:phosphoacetylglucosamine mutase